MRERAIQRLQQLRAELELGQKQMGLLEARRDQLQATLLRITGAIQVLEELLAAQPEVHAVAAPEEPDRAPDPVLLSGSR
ncbi:MAG: hypothetical protein IRZ16_19065 [Myxococcaceae bacterium]|nr:hypothetical protein [Myxococcaceae bacterium]